MSRRHHEKDRLRTRGDAPNRFTDRKITAGVRFGSKPWADCLYCKPGEFCDEHRCHGVVTGGQHRTRRNIGQRCPHPAVTDGMCATHAGLTS